MKRSPQRGQVMLSLPLPRGTRSVFLQAGQLKYLWVLISFRRLKNFFVFAFIGAQKRKNLSFSRRRALIFRESIRIRANISRTYESIEPNGIRKMLTISDTTTETTSRAVLNWSGPYRPIINLRRKFRITKCPLKPGKINKM